MDEAMGNRCPLEHPWLWTVVVLAILGAVAALVRRGVGERRKLRGLEAEFAAISQA